MSMSNGVTGGVFVTLADLQASKPREGTIVSINGIEYTVNTTNFGEGIAVDSLFANPVEMLVTSLLNSTIAVQASDIRNVTGFSTVGVGGAEWKATGNIITASQTPALTGNATCSDANGNEFELIHNGVMTVLQLGALSDGSDNSVVFQAALNAVGSGGAVIVPSIGRYTIDLDITVPIGTSLKGTQVNNGGDNFFGQDWFDQIGGMILLNSSSSITVKASGTLENLSIFRKGISVVPLENNSSFAGTAIVLGGDAVLQNYDTCVKNCLICGFDKSIDGLKCSNALIEKVMIDCNNGILADTGGNPVIIKDCLGWPFLTVAYSPFVSTQLIRPGYFIKLQNNVDASKISKCTAFDYNKGVILDSANGVEICQSGFDAPDDVSAIGLEIVNATGITQVTNCQFVANAKGIVFNPIGNTDVLLLTNTYFTANLTNDIEHIKGTLIATGGAQFGSDVTNTIEVVDSGAVLIIDDANCTKTSGAFVQNVGSTPFITIGSNVKVASGCAFYSGASVAVSVASAGTVDLRQGAVIEVTGTSNIFGLIGGWPGRVVTLSFTASLVLTTSAGMNLSGNFSATSNDTLTVHFTSASQCFEISRSVN